MHGVSNQLAQLPLLPGLVCAVPRVKAVELSPQRFRESFALPRRPLIIEGLAPTVSGGRWQPPPPPPPPQPPPGDEAGSSTKNATTTAPTARGIPQWGTAAYWVAQCGESGRRSTSSNGSGAGDVATVQLVRYKHGAKAWGGHVAAHGGGPHTLETFIGMLQQEAATSSSSSSSLQGGDEVDGGKATAQPYLADFPLLGRCSEGKWRHDWHVPPYFALDLIQSLANGTDGDDGGGGSFERRDSWPSLFVGGAGTRTGLHTDYGSSHFWMLVTEGQKEWAVFPAQMAPFLYANPSLSLPIHHCFCLETQYWPPIPIAIVVENRVKMVLGHVLCVGDGWYVCVSTHRYKGWSRPVYPVSPWGLSKGTSQRPLSAVRPFFICPYLCPFLPVCTPVPSSESDGLTAVDVGGRPLQAARGFRAITKPGAPTTD